MKDSTRAACRKKRDKRTTPVVYTLQQKVRITNPFHPRFLEEFSLVQYRCSRGVRAQVHLQDEKGKVFSVPLSSTDAEEEDSFIHISAGKSYFHIKELVRLVYLIEGLVKGSLEKSYNKKDEYV